MLSKENLTQKTIADETDTPCKLGESVFIKRISIPIKDKRKTCFAVVNGMGKVVSLFETKEQAQFYSMTHNYQLHSLM